MSVRVSILREPAGWIVVGKLAGIERERVYMNCSKEQAIAEGHAMHERLALLDWDRCVSGEIQQIEGAI